MGPGGIAIAGVGDGRLPLKIVDIDIEFQVRISEARYWVIAGSATWGIEA
jgi:hypothetical protein